MVNYHSSQLSTLNYDYQPLSIQVVIEGEKDDRPNVLSVAYDIATSEQANALRDTTIDPEVLLICRRYGGREGGREGEYWSGSLTMMIIYTVMKDVMFSEMAWSFTTPMSAPDASVSLSVDMSNWMV